MFKKVTLLVKKSNSRKYFFLPDMPPLKAEPTPFPPKNRKPSLRKKKVVKLTQISPSHERPTRKFEPPKKASKIIFPLNPPPKASLGEKIDTISPLPKKPTESNSTKGFQLVRTAFFGDNSCQVFEFYFLRRGCRFSTFFRGFFIQGWYFFWRGGFVSILTFNFLS